MPGHVRAPFKYTIPILRATEENGDLFLEGEASGPEIDVYDTRVHPDVIASFQDQITARAQMGDPIMYRDTHAQGVLGENPVMSDLGEIVAAAITDEHHLVVRVKLDKENPASLFLHRQITRGKKYGMSIGGEVLTFADEYVRDLGRIVRTFTSVALDHIANTTQPAWTPSLGTVLMRAVEKAMQGENMDPEVPAPETPAPAAEGAEESAPEAAAEVAEAVAETAEETPEVVDEAVAEETTEETTEVHTIEASALQPIADAVAALASAVSQLMANQTPAPVAVMRSEESTDAARSVESESPVADASTSVTRAEFELLRTELAAANDRIRQLEAEPAGNEPGVIQRSEPNVQDELAKLDPHSRLLLGLQAAKAAQE